MPSKFEDVSSALFKVVSSNGPVETAKGLMKAGASSSNDRGKKSKQTALHKAAELNNLLMMQMLLTFPHDLSIRDISNATPIVVAARKKYWIIVNEIAKKRTNVSDSFNYGSALLSAVKDNQYLTARLLLEAGAKTDWHTMPEEHTIYHCAVNNDNPDMILLLRHFQEDYSTTNKAGVTALTLATTLKYQECIKAFTAPLLPLKPLLFEKSEKTAKQEQVFSALAWEFVATKNLASHYRQKSEYGRAMLFAALVAVSEESLLSEKAAWKESLNVPVGNWKFWSFNGTDCLRKFLSYCLSQNIFQSIKDKYNITDPMVMFMVALEEVQTRNDYPFLNQSSKLALTKSRLKQSICSTYVDSGMTKSEAERLYNANEESVAEMIAKKQREQEVELQPGSNGERQTLS